MINKQIDILINRQIDILINRWIVTYVFIIKGKFAVLVMPVFCEKNTLNRHNTKQIYIFLINNKSFRAS